MENILNSVSISKAKELIKPIAAMAHKGIAPLNVMLTGSPGLGKSTIVKDIAKEMGFGLIDLRLASLDPTDVGGLPFVSDGVMKFSDPEWFKEIMENADKPYIIFLDEVTNASISTQAAAYRLLLDREINNGKKLPDTTFIIGAGNTKEDQSGAKPLIPPFANRFGLHLYIDKRQAADSFIQHAVENRFDRNIIGFLSYKKSNVSVPYNNNPSFATPRTWEFVDTYLKEQMYEGSDLDLVIAGAVGTDVAVEFSSYRKLHSKLPDWNKLINDDSYDYTLPQDDEALKYALSIGLAIELLDCLSIDNAKGVKRLSAFLEEFSDEIKILVFRTMKKDSQTMRKFVKYAELLKEFKSISKYVLGE